VNFELDEVLLPVGIPEHTGALVQPSTNLNEQIKNVDLGKGDQNIIIRELIMISVMSIKGDYHVSIAICRVLCHVIVV
jgi:hypothetical protein